MEQPRSFVEPSPRRVRVRLAGVVVADTQRAQLLVQYGPWTHPDPSGGFAALDGHVTFSWRQLEWYEEDERVWVHARDPHARVDTLRSSRRVEVRVGGELVASSVRPLLLFETLLPVRYYLPFDDVRRDLLVASDLVTQCPYKGVARYWSVRVGDTVEPHLAWSYPDPIPENPKIKDLVAFFTERVDLTVDPARAPGHAVVAGAGLHDRRHPARRVAVRTTPGVRRPGPRPCRSGVPGCPGHLPRSFRLRGPPASRTSTG